MSLYKRGAVWWADYSTPSGKRVRESLGTTDKREAKELHDSLISNHWRVERLGDYPDVTFDEMCLRWLQEKSHKKSIDDDKARISFWLNHFSGVEIKAITDAKVYSALSNLEHRHKSKEISVATKAKYLGLMRAMLRKAEKEWRWIHKAPSIQLPKVSTKRIRWLTKSEAERLVNHCCEPLKSVVEFALCTGLRRSNIINLEWSQIDMQRGVAWINPEQSKTGKAIGIPLNKTAKSILRRQIGNHDSWVFVHKRRANRADGSETDAVRKMRVDDNTSFNLALKKAGISDFRFHDLRHTWASWLVQAGVPLLALQEMGGWESVEMVRRYAHLAPNHLTEHASKIDEILGHVTITSQCSVASK